MFWFNILVGIICVACIPAGVWFKTRDKSEYSDQVTMTRWYYICGGVCVACIIYGFMYFCYLDANMVYRP